MIQISSRPTLRSSTTGHTVSRSASSTSPDLTITKSNPSLANTIKVNGDHVPVALRLSKGTNKTLKPVPSRDDGPLDKQGTVPDTRKRTRDGKPAIRQAAGDVLTNENANHALHHDNIPITNGCRTVNGSIQVATPSDHDTTNARTKAVPQRQGKSGEETRSLRSQAGGSRLKSDLATYFPNFEDVISGAPQSPEYIGFDEPILIIDVASQPQPKPQTSRLPLHTKQPNSAPNFDRIDLFALASLPITSPTTDPLDDSVFLPCHRRAERREKQLRNIEKERAQHEKGQLETLLDSLQGPDWLKVMGVTGVTDGARKEYEPKRDYFVKEVRALLRKFRIWKEAEKRLIQEKAAREEDENEEDAEAGAQDITDTEDDLSTSDADAWAARQLRLEAKSAQSKSTRPQQRHRPRQQLPPKPPEPPKPFTSFFSKPHVRAAALGQGRPGRRTVLAFGHPIPESLHDTEFGLPDEFLTAEVLMAQARKRRRMNREKREAAMEKAKTSK